MAAEKVFGVSPDTKIENNTFVKPLEVQKIKTQLDYRKFKMFYIEKESIE